jgi:hypothetical protein
LPSESLFEPLRVADHVEMRKATSGSGNSKCGIKSYA